MVRPVPAFIIFLKTLPCLSPPTSLGLSRARRHSSSYHFPGLILVLNYGVSMDFEDVCCALLQHSLLGEILKWREVYGAEEGYFNTPGLVVVQARPNHHPETLLRQRYSARPWRWWKLLDIRRKIGQPQFRWWWSAWWTFSRNVQGYRELRPKIKLWRTQERRKQ